MRFIALGDNHFKIGPRFAECNRVHRFAADEIAREKPDVVLLTGDLYDADSVPDERMAAAEFIQACADVAPVLQVQGNHGRRRDLRILAKIRAKHPVIVEEAAKVHHVGGAAIAVVAWPERASIAAMIGRPVSPSTTDQFARELMRQTFVRLGDEMAAHRGPKLVMGHFMVDGATAGAGQPLIGAELALLPEDFALARAHMVVMGHIHRAQHWTLEDGTVVAYAGAPYRTDYGEAHDTPSLLAGEITEEGVVAWERIRTPARPMHLCQGAYYGGALHIEVPEPVANADIRLRYDVTDAERVAAKLAAKELEARLYAAGAADVQIDPVAEVVVRVRSPEVAAAVTREGQLKARWALRGVPEERQVRMLAKYEQVKAATS